jgi:hypothetical protein
MMIVLKKIVSSALFLERLHHVDEAFNAIINFKTEEIVGH